MVPSGLGEQADVVWANIAAIFSEAGMSVATSYPSRPTWSKARRWRPVMAARDAFDGHIAASTLVTVPALARPEWRVEIAIVAAGR